MKDLETKKHSSVNHDVRLIKLMQNEEFLTQKVVTIEQENEMLKS